MISLKNLKIIINKKAKLINIFKLLIDFREYYDQKKVNMKKIIKDFRDYYNQKKIRNVNR